MEFKKVVTDRHSCRSFSSKKVSFNDISLVLDAARYAPCAGNICSVRLILVSDKDAKVKIADAALGQEFLRDVTYVIVVCSDPTATVRSYGARAETYARQQAGAAIENMLLKIHDLGLAGCWVGAFDEIAVKRILNIPAHIQVEALIPVGHELKKNVLAEKREKIDLYKILNFERWGVDYTIRKRNVEAL
jgi:nitroreductase